MYSTDDIRTIALIAAQTADFYQLEQLDANEYEKEIKRIAATAVDIFDGVANATRKVK